jgi:hypothetical protein
MDTVRDRFWIWGHDAGSHNTGWNLPGPSRITPVEAAWYLGTPNMIMVRYSPESLQASAQYAIPFRSLRRVLWSVVGGGGLNSSDDTARALALPASLPNMTGVMMDDFFHDPQPGEEAGTLSVAQLQQIRGELDARTLDLWVVLYTYQLHLPVTDQLAFCNGLTLWTWKAADLKDLEANLSRAETLAPKTRRMLGCYMWDYGTNQPMPVELMQRQCETGLRWLREGRIEGMVFLASCICDLELESVEWTRRWIASVGDTAL